MSIFLTGHSGFVGKYLVSYIGNKMPIRMYLKGSKIKIQEDIVIHLAGKAHDLKKVTSPAEYYTVNTDLTKEVFDAFISSSAKVFIAISSVKAVTDNLAETLTEEFIPNPVTHYGKSKLLGEQYIFSKNIPEGKRVYVLRPCMIHGPGNKGNLNLLYNFISKGFPWPFGSFDNSRSYCSVENLCFIITELSKREDIASGIYNIADDNPLSTNYVVRLIADTLGKKLLILNISKHLIFFLMRLGDYFNLPLNTDVVEKLTETYVVSNHKIIKAIGKPLPVNSTEGLINTFKSFSSNG